MNRSPVREIMALPAAFYGAVFACDIMRRIGLMSIGNLPGNRFDAFRDRNALRKLVFYLAAFWPMVRAEWLLLRQRAGHPATVQTGDAS